MEKAKTLVNFLNALSEEFREHAKDIEAAYKHLQEEQKQEESKTESINDLAASFEPGAGTGFALFALNVKYKRAINTLREANAAITNALRYLGNEKKIKPDKVIEGNIQTLNNISDLCAALAGKMETEIKIQAGGADHGQDGGGEAGR